LRSATRVSTFGFTAGPQLRTTLSEGRGYGEAGGEGVVPPLPQADEGCCQLMFRRQTKIYKLQAETFRSARLAPTAGNAPACSGKVCAIPPRPDSVAPAGCVEPAGPKRPSAEGHGLPSFTGASGPPIRMKAPRPVIPIPQARERNLLLFSCRKSRFLVASPCTRRCGASLLGMTGVGDFPRSATKDRLFFCLGRCRANTGQGWLLGPRGRGLLLRRLARPLPPSLPTAPDGDARSGSRSAIPAAPSRARPAVRR